MNPVPPDDVLTAVQSALRAGEKIAAIKLYREATGVGLAEAKAAVEALEAGLPIAASAERMASAEDDGVKAAVLAGRKIEAIKLYRAAMGVGLAEAKAAVEKLTVQWRGEGLPIQRSGCLSLLALCVLPTVSAAYWWIRG